MIIIPAAPKGILDSRLMNALKFYTRFLAILVSKMKKIESKEITIFQGELNQKER
jgi:hypothetical protein